MTKLVKQQKLQDAKQRQRDQRLTQPTVKIVTPDTPFIPPVDSRQGGYIGQRTLLRDVAGRYIEL